LTKKYSACVVHEEKVFRNCLMRGRQLPIGRASSAMGR